MLAPLFVRSTYSFLYGTIPPAALAREAKRMGYEAIALTDRNGVYGIPSFAEACEKEGILPIFGTELTWDAGRCVLLARNRSGFSAICRMLTRRAEGNFDARAALLACIHADREREGLAILSEDPAFLAAASRSGGVEAGCGRGNPYALLTRDNRSRWKSLMDCGRSPVAAPEVAFLAPGERKIQRLLVAIGAGKTLDEVRNSELSGPQSLLPAPEELRQLYADCPQALEGTERLVGGMEAGSLFGGWVFPRYRPEKGLDAAKILRGRVLEGARARYGGLSPRVMKRIDYELAIIHDKGFSDYFLVVKDIVAGSGRTCGRGSAAASIVSYSLGITDVDPLRHGLYFERFLNPGRKDPPDIDVDFAWDERDALLEKTLAGFGAAHAARVANHICFQPRSALRETARAQGMPEGEISAFERRLAVDSARTLAEADPTWKDIALLSESIVGFPRHLGAHSGGLIVVPDELADHVPLELTGTGIRVTAWDKEGVEAAGLVKIDLLGNRSLAVVRDALAGCTKNGKALDEAVWKPLDDPSTVALLARGDTMGVFYVESPAMRMLQKKTGAGDYEHLVIHSSIIRPAANRFIGAYIDRLKGKPYEPLHPSLSGLLAETFGIMCYQEDVCKVAVALAGFSPAEADGIRKILSKKDATTRLVAYREQFRAGAAAKGVEAATIATVWEMMESFAGYSFVKAHSASYAMLSFRSAFLRAHHPAEFMAAVMSNHGGYYSTLAYASESRRMGLRLLPPDLNESEERCTGKEDSIRFGLSMIASLGAPTIASILAERSARGHFSGIEDFARRVRLDRSEAEALCGAGALDSLAQGSEDRGACRPDILMRLLCVCASREGGGRKGAELEFGETEAPSTRLFRARARGKPDSRAAILDAQMRYLGTTLAVHPLSLWPQALSQPRNLARDLPLCVGRTVDLVGWPITSKPVLTSREEVMEFVSFEDETAMYESVLFPETYRKYRHLLFGDAPLFVRGRVEEDRGALAVTVISLESVASPLRSGMRG
jgi:DNA polymerase-3 subunit alpha/error-prone DNA polymerase